MSKRALLAIIAGMFLQTTIAVAGIEWQSRAVNKARGKESTILAQVYAQNGIVREEFVQVTGQNPLMAKGMFWLFKGDSSKVYIVNPEEKTYFAVNFDSMMQFASSMSQYMQMTITNPSVEIKALDPETVSSYLCKHIIISSSYDMEMKVMVMKIKNHIESVQEIWATDVVSFNDLAGAFRTKSFKTGIEGIDKLIQLQMEKFKNIGFTIKSITTQTTTSGGKTETSTSETMVTNIVTHPLNNDLFVIPADYKETSFIPKMPGGE
jgi:hypothetical protein